MTTTKEAKYIFACRVALGKTQGEFLDFLQDNGIDWNRTSLSEVENGKRLPDKLTFARIVALMGKQKIEVIT